MKIISLLKLLVWAIIGITILASCGKDNLGIGRDGNGQLVTENYNLPFFSEIDLKIEAEVVLTQGETPSVTVEGEENILEVLNLDVRNRQWEIKFDQWVDDYETLRIFITVEDLRKVIITGSGDIRTESPFLVDEMELRLNGSGDLFFQTEADKIDARITGSGSMDLQGQTDFLDVSVSGSGDLHAFELLAKNAEVNVNGSGDVEVLVENFLDAKILGSGDIYYKGDPVVEEKTTGSGEVIKVD